MNATLIILSLIAPFVTALAWLAYNHHEFYSKLSKLLYKLSFYSIIAVTAYNFGIYQSELKLLKPLYEQIGMAKGDKLIQEQLKNQLLPFWSIWVLYVFFAIYLFFLDNLHYFLKKKEKN
jgi:hypothetical protein